MKRIFLACGAGVATSSVIAERVEEFLVTNKLDATSELITCSIEQANAQAKQQDLVISTAPTSMQVACPVINGVPFLTSVGKAQAEQTLLDLIK